MKKRLNLTLDELIEATELCGSGVDGACADCPAHCADESFACIEYVMAQANAALKEYACNGGCGE